MTQEDGKLLLKDLCARLPYGAKCKINDYPEPYYLSGVTHVGCYFNFGSVFESLEDIKPYLRPLSSMTKEEADDFYNNGSGDVDNRTDVKGLWCRNDSVLFEDINYAIDWLNRNHFDYRGLIEKGLALVAPDDMY